MNQLLEKKKKTTQYFPSSIFKSFFCIFTGAEYLCTNSQSQYGVATVVEGK